MDIDGEDYPDQMTLELYYDVPMTTVIPAFIISELRYAFIMGFLIYIPFIVIDMVVASVLMSMGMMCCRRQRFHCRLRYCCLFWRMVGIW